jgi:protein CpxP
MSITRNNFWLYMISGILITANIVTLALLWTHKAKNDDNNHFRKPQGGPQLFEYISRELKFDQKQKDAYAVLRDEHHSGTEKLQDSIKAAKDELFMMLQQGNASEESITAQSNKAAALTARLDVFTFHHFQKVRALCTPDQQKRFDEIIQEAIHSMAQPQGPPRGAGHPGMPPPDNP